MKIKTGETFIHISILFFILPPIMLAAGYFKEYAAAFLSIGLHEMGHIAAARIYGCKPSAVKLLPIGLSVSINDRNCTGKGLLIIYLAGPCINLMLFSTACLAYSVSQNAGAFWETVAATNAYLALFNLIPAYPLDGGRILLELLSGRMGLLAAGRLARWLTFILALLILVFGAFQMYASVYNFSLIIIGLYIIVLWKDSKMESALMNIRQIIYRHSRLKKKGIYPARELVAMKSTRLDEILKYMDFDRFHLIHVLSDDLRLLRVFTEAEIMDAVTAGVGTTFGELLEMEEKHMRAKENGKDKDIKTNIDI